jgi:hypothetical protein
MEKIKFSARSITTSLIYKPLSATTSQQNQHNRHPKGRSPGKTLGWLGSLLEIKP